MWSQETCKCAVAGWVHGAKWESQFEKQAKCHENGNSSKWEFGQHFQKQASKWDPICSKMYCRFSNAAGCPKFPFANSHFHGTLLVAVLDSHLG